VFGSFRILFNALFFKTFITVNQSSGYGAELIINCAFLYTEWCESQDTLAIPGSKVLSTWKAAMLNA
jgi:hypothetical protein